MSDKLYTVRMQRTDHFEVLVRAGDDAGAAEIAEQFLLHNGSNDYLTGSDGFEHLRAALHPNQEAEADVG